MIKQDIPLYKIDLEGNSPFNLVSGEYGKRNNNLDIFIPGKAPFYQKSFKMYDITGTPLIYGKHYEFYGILAKLTQYTAMDVGLFIRIKDPSIKEWLMDYQVVGNFNKITNEILNMLKTSVTGSGLVTYDNIKNKPLWFVPELHKQDLAYDIYGFTDLVNQLSRVADHLSETASPSEFMFEKYKIDIEAYIDGYKVLLDGILNSHKANMMNAHGVTKKQIGRGNVDNIATATLDQTLEGLRSDLRISVYNAGQAVSALSGRNDKFFPAGSLPILRYGSNTFIPPTIGGSFEGMGGMYQNCGVIAEPDGTLLILERRNNGKTKGLYFIKGTNWGGSSPTWEFTGYRYQHPTATAAGAELNFIMNGSDDKVMVVGDIDKNIWFWCKTNGTFNPDRHVLYRITNPDFLALNKSFQKAYVVTPDSPDDLVMVVFSINYAQLATYRTGLLASSETGGGTRELEGFLLYVLNTDNDFYPAKLTYKTSTGKQYTDDLAFTPYERTQGLSPTGVKGVAAFHANFTDPISSVWTYRMQAGFCAKTNTAGTFAFMTIQRLLLRAFSGVTQVHAVPYRAKIKVVKGTSPTIVFTPGEGEQSLYTINVANYGASPDLVNYVKWKRLEGIQDSLEYQGYAKIPNGRILFLGGLNGYAFPAQPVINSFKWLDVDNGLVEGQPDTPWTRISSNVCKEYNPIGLGSYFINQTHMVSDSSNYATAGVLARQVNANLQTEWIFRPMQFLTATWDANASKSSMALSNRAVNYYPFVSDVKKTNIGAQIVLNVPNLDIGNPKAADRYKQVFGADVFSNILGTNGNGAKGDGLLVRKNTITTVDGVINFNPTIVYNMIPSVARDFVAKFAAAGLNTDQVVNSWTLVQIFTADTGAEFQLFQAAEVSTDGKTLRLAAVLCKVTGKGTPTTVNGYQYYDDVNVEFTSDVKIITYDTNALFQVFSNGGYGANQVYQHSSVNLINGNGQPGSGLSTAMVKSLSRYSSFGSGYTLEALYEFKNDATEIVRMARYAQNYIGIENKLVVSPGSGQGVPTNTMELAGIVSQEFNYGNGGTVKLYDAILAASTKAEYQLGMSNLLVSQYIIYFNKMENLILAGRMYDIEGTYIDILTVDPNPANKTFYVYLIYDNNQAGYVVTQDVRPETTTQSMIAKVLTGPSQIDNIIPYNRFTMDGAQVTTVRQGSAIRASLGSLYEQGDTTTMMAASDFIPE